ncbi:Nn.00g088200.m01.CDS01 [Neocucurbitaria sp. VM-36]
MAPTTTKTATPKATSGAGVRKAGRPKGAGKNSKAKTAMIKMQAYFKENRSKYKHLDFKEQQKELGKEWKSSSENPKNQA